MKKNIATILSLFAVGISLASIVITVKLFRNTSSLGQPVSKETPPSMGPEVRLDTNPKDPTKQSATKDDILTRLTRLEEQVQALNMGAPPLPPAGMGHPTGEPAAVSLEELKKMAENSKGYEREFQERLATQKRDDQKRRQRSEEEAKKFGTTFAQMQNELYGLEVRKEGNSYIQLTHDELVPKYRQFIEKYPGTLLSAEASSLLGSIYLHSKGQYDLAEEAFLYAYKNSFKSDVPVSSKKGDIGKNVFDYERSGLLYELVKTMVYNGKLEEAAKLMESEGGYPDGKKAIADILYGGRVP